jgi:hypothetical protein
MKKILWLFLAAVLLTNTLPVAAAEESFVTEEYAREFADIFVQIIDYAAQNDTNMSNMAQSYGSWVYFAALEWAALLEETGKFTEVKSTELIEMSPDIVVVVAEARCTRRNAVLEFTLYPDREPEVTMYSKFSLTTLVAKTDLGPSLTIINSVVLLLVIFVLWRRRGPAKEEPGTAIDHAIAGIVRNEELTSDKELVAVIAAAIAASEGMASADGLVVRSIRKHRKAGLRRLA